jgi:hypothetical protein
MSLTEQLGNAGSEVDRAIRAQRNGRTDRSAAAFDRALELIDLTVTDPKRTLTQRREILRAREQFCRLFFDTTAETDLGDYLTKYFLAFATAARLERERRTG